MLNKCANTACPRAFRSLSHGKLFLLEIDHAERPVASSSLPGRNTLVPALHLKKVQPMKGYPRRIERAL